MRSRPAGATALSAREAAFVVLHRAEAADAFVNVLLFRTLAPSALGPRDRALATALTLGVLRHRGRIDHALTHLLRRPLETLPAAIRTALRIGGYQLLALDRIPSAAAVSEAVDLARRHGHRGTARLVNAVLRRLAAEGPPPPPDPGADPVGHLAVVHSHPRWLMARWAARWGIQEAAALAAAHARPAPSVLRVNTLRVTRAEVLAWLAARGMPAGPGLLPESVRTRGSLSGRLPLVEAGAVLMQDEAAMLVAHVVAPSPGQVVFDACAAPGGKASHLGALMGNTGRVVACDVHPGKAAAMARRLAALGATCVEAHQVDALEVGRRWPMQAHAVLVDAPCSGLGTLRRRPEIRWRVGEPTLAQHAARQRAVLEGASGAVRPGGALVYSVCSLEPEEGPEVVRAFLAGAPSFAFDPFPPQVPRVLGGASVHGADAGEACLFPHRHDTDGFYIARLRRR